MCVRPCVYKVEIKKLKGLLKKVNIFFKVTKEKSCNLSVILEMLEAAFHFCIILEDEIVYRANAFCLFLVCHSKGATAWCRC